MLEVKNLSVNYGEFDALHNLTFSADNASWLMIVGPNGAGKSTAVSAISQSIKYSGEILLDGKNLKEFKPKQLAQNIGVLSQKNSAGYSFTVNEIVRLGRYAYSDNVFGTLSDEDSAHIANALEKTGMAEFAEKSILTLSGGELQRAFLAQVFAQNPKMLILDEPTNHLDLVYQKQVFELIEKWISDTGRSVISVVHDLSLARAYGTHALLLDGGRTVAFGKAKDVLNRENLSAAYSMDVFGWTNELLSAWTD